MSKDPQISVVMSTYNEADHLPASIESVLSQDWDDFEYIIVNDGSPDPNTRELLAEYEERDSRIRVITKTNEGLTKALIDGCAVARGEYIARIDADDRYLPGRLRKQILYLQEHPEVVLLSCGTRFLTKENEFLFERQGGRDAASATSMLRSDRGQDVRGIHGHGSAMFRRADYEIVGGYRPQFYFAQDIDLWMRLTDLGFLAFLPEILYEVVFDPLGVSGRYSREQQRLTELVCQMRRRRESRRDETDLLSEAARMRPSEHAETFWRRTRRAAQGFYFVGSVLRQNGDPNYRSYMRKALCLNPLDIRPILKLV
jgi:glycosyltransferase involved in cell wall biosynthesis